MQESVEDVVGDIGSVPPENPVSITHPAKSPESKNKVPVIGIFASTPTSTVVISILNPFPGILPGISTALNEGWVFIWLSKSLYIAFEEAEVIVVNVWVTPSAEVNNTVKLLIWFGWFVNTSRNSIVAIAGVPGYEGPSGTITQSSTVKHSNTNKP